MLPINQVSNIYLLSIKIFPLDYFFFCFKPRFTHRNKHDIVFCFLQIAKIDFPMDKVKDQRRAFCFIEFESEDAVKKVLETESHTVSGHDVSLKHL